MTRNAARASLFRPFRRKPSRRWAGLPIAALMFGVGLLAAARPAASCSGTARTVTDTTSSGPWQYTCHFRCRPRDLPERMQEIGQYTLVGRYEAMSCRALCAMDHRCRAVAWHDELQVIDGRNVVVRYCTLYGRGDFATEDTHDAVTTGIDTHVLCLLEKWGLQKPAPQDLDIRVDPRDQHRPGVPGPNVPFKR